MRIIGSSYWSRLPMHHCNTERVRWSRTGPVPMIFRPIMILISNQCGRIPVGRSWPRWVGLELFSLSLRVDLFAVGDDFPWETVANGRNLYYQQQVANQIQTQVADTLSLITTALNIHLNLGQTSTMTTSSVIMSVETLTANSLPNKLIQPIGNAGIRIPFNFTALRGYNQLISLRVRAMFDL